METSEANHLKLLPLVTVAGLILYQKQTIFYLITNVRPTVGLKGYAEVKNLCRTFTGHRFANGTKLILENKARVE